ncbi:MAG: mevalonate kinase [Flavobacteriia bacterium]|nr:mevalonate kinase [Flavobacteriia bacterium]
MKDSLFFAKILLFGEYGIIKDSKGLSIPYNFFRGTLKLAQEIIPAVAASHQSLCDYAKYLRGLSPELLRLDWDRLQADLDHDLYFDSSIPQGYGVGSSGALVAAFYDRYALDKLTPEQVMTPQNLKKLKSVFAAMESYFHGQSSGLDPLNSYLSLPLLIHSKDSIETIVIPAQDPKGKGAVFLLDSGSVASTAPMVSLFMENMKEEAFSKMMREEFTHITDRCVDNFLKGHFKSLFGNIKTLSTLVLKYFKPMIPGEFHELWKKGLETNAYYLKLCGSGGGGYMLGFTQDFSSAQEALEGHRLEVVYHF